MNDQEIVDKIFELYEKYGVDSYILESRTQEGIILGMKGVAERYWLRTAPRRWIFGFVEVGKLNRKSVYADGWRYLMPDTTPNAEGRIVLISKASLAPLEKFEWGIDADNEPYEQYEWLEDDFFETSNYFKNITRSELDEQIENLIHIFRKAELPEMVTAYLKMQDWLHSQYHPIVP